MSDSKISYGFPPLEWTEETVAAYADAAVLIEQQRCAQVIQDWRNKLDNRTEQLEGWVAEQLYYAVLGLPNPNDEKPV